MKTSVLNSATRIAAGWALVCLLLSVLLSALPGLSARAQTAPPAPVRILIMKKAMMKAGVASGKRFTIPCQISGHADRFAWKLLTTDKGREITMAQGDLTPENPVAALHTKDFPSGDYRFIIAAYDGKSETAVRQEEAPLTLIAPDQGMAFIVGIEDYQQNPLPYMSNDASDFAESLIKNFAYLRNNVYTVTARDGKITVNDGQKESVLPGLLTKEFLEKEFNKFLAQAKKFGAQHFIIYYSGHGTANKVNNDDEMVMPAGDENISTHEWAGRLLTELPNENNPVSNYTVIGLYQSSRDNAEVRDDGDHIFGSDKAGKEKSARYFALPSCAPNYESHVDVDQDPQAIGIKHGYFGQALLNALDSLKDHREITAFQLYSRVDAKLADVIARARKITGNNAIEQRLPEIVPPKLPAIHTKK